MLVHSTLYWKTRFLQHCLIYCCISQAITSLAILLNSLDCVLSENDKCGTGNLLIYPLTDHLLGTREWPTCPLRRRLAFRLIFDIWPFRTSVFLFTSCGFKNKIDVNTNRVSWRVCDSLLDCLVTFSAKIRLLSISFLCFGVAPDQLSGNITVYLCSGG